MNNLIDTQKEAEEAIGPELAYLILESVNGGYKDYSDNVTEKSRAICGPSAKASFINDHMVYHARELMGKHPDVAFVPRNGRTHLLIKQRVEIKLKKLNSRRRSSNIVTDAVLRYNNQLPLPLPFQMGFPDFIDPITHLIAGYQTNRLKTGIEAVYIVCPLGKRNKWEWRIDFVAPPEPVINLNTPPSNPPEACKVVAKKVKVQAL
jgi:hypothetical protein